jgi:hypothetical protein
MVGELTRNAMEIFSKEEEAPVVGVVRGKSMAFSLRTAITAPLHCPVAACHGEEYCWAASHVN